MRDKDELNADIAEDGAITVENHFVGRLKGFRFTLDTAEDGIHGKATRQAATQVLTRELGMRVRRVAAAPNDAFKITRDARILWRDDEVANLEATEDPLAPAITLLVDENLGEADREKVLLRLQTWLKDTIAEKLKPLVDMSAATDLQGLARGIAFRLKENFGVLRRESVADEINALDQAARADLRKYGLRFGAFNIFFPLMLKPAAADLAATLWLLKNPVAAPADGGAAALPLLPRPGLTSVAADPATPEALYRANGFHVCGPRAVRLDILERLADLIRPLLAFRTKPDVAATPPKGATGDGGFRATDDMMSILGCSADELGNVLKALGFRLDRRAIPTPPKTAVSTDVAAGVAASEASAVSPEPVPEPIEAVADATNDIAAEVATSISAETAIETKPVDAAATEEKFEDIWRPRRHPRPERPQNRDNQTRDHHRRGNRGGQHRTSSVAGAAEGTAVAEGATPAADASAPAAVADRGPRQNDRHQGRRDHRNGPPGERAKTDHQRDNRHQGKPGGQKPGESRSDRPRDGNRPDRGSNRGGPRDGGRREEGRRQSEVISAAPPKRAGADPDSPFAKLAALKASMDKRGEGPGSR